MFDEVDVMDEVQQLSFAKQFADDADRQLSRRDDYGNGQAVSLAQDAIELIIRSACRHRQVNNMDKASLDEMVKRLDECELKAGRAQTPHVTRIRDVNVTRNAFKHRGIAVTEADAQRLVRYGVDFAETAVPQFFDLEWKSLSLADAIRDEKVRRAIKHAEASIAEERYTEALTAAATAVRSLESILERLMPTAKWSGEFDSNRATTNYLNGLRLIALAALVQIDVRGVLRFQNLGVNVLTSPSGNPQTILTKGRPPTPEEAHFGVEFARNFALAVQARLG